VTKDKYSYKSISTPDLFFFVLVLFRNVIHGSDAVESAQKEIALWFPDGVTEWRSSVHPWIYEN
jgi:nucleoside-diphosphate kinase